MQDVFAFIEACTYCVKPVFVFEFLALADALIFHDDLQPGIEIRQFAQAAEQDFVLEFDVGEDLLDRA